ncbi:interferon-induced transmembrane protein 1-like [Eucyclogobius newberryi]|uniref:interferon-induced transmembrane protein 1-like n=1 Tax=Eucyclogobius newberryi TaxID=166745 RepID=UPI003B5A358C
MQVQPESVPLQTGNVCPPYNPYVGHPTVVHHTRVQVTREMPRDHFLCSLFIMLYCGNPLCLGLAALIHSVKARDRKVAGDIEGAQRHGSTASTLNTCSIVLFVLSVITVVIMFSVLTAKISHIYDSYGRGYGYGGYQSYT